MAKVWKNSPDTELLRVGEKYRLSQLVNVPYNATAFAALKARWKAQEQYKPIRVDAFTVYVPRELVNGVSVPGSVWWFRVEYHVVPTDETSQAGLDPRVIFALAALVIAAAAALAVSGQRMERLVETSAAAAGGVIAQAGQQTQGIIKQVFNPGVVILAVVGIFLITRKG